MARKRWTQQTEITQSLLSFRQKKKWQIALRRYVLEGQKSLLYAPYFGLDIENFRKWIALQFDQEMNWDNFSSRWQLDHIVPVTYFNFEKEADLRLCWNFINIRPNKLGEEKTGTGKIDVLSAKTYFKTLFEKTGLEQCRKMVNKIEAIEQEKVKVDADIAQFLKSHREQIETLATFNQQDFERLNTGTPFSELAFEKEFLKKFA